MLLAAAEPPVPPLLSIALIIMAGVLLFPMVFLIVGEMISGWTGNLGEWLIPTTLVAFILSIIFVVIAGAMS